MLEGRIRAVLSHTDELNSLRAAVSLAFQRALGRPPCKETQMADGTRGTLPNGISVKSIKHGDIVQVRCYHSHNFRVHKPFLLTRTSLGHLHFFGDEGFTFWTVLCLLKTSEFSRKEEIWVAVRPCYAVVESLLQKSLRVSLQKV